MFPTKFRFIWPSSYRGEDSLEINQSETRTDRDEMSNLYRGPAIDASYQVSVHLAKWFQRRRFLKNRPIRNKNWLWWPCLLRHMKTHLKDPTASGQTYNCSICDKVLSRADTRKRHDAVHNYSLTCGVCVQYFNRLDNVARHRAQNERPDAKQRLPMKRPAAPEPGPVTKQRRTVSPPARTPMENPVGPDVLPEDPETRVLYLRHWKSCFSELTL